MSRMKKANDIRTDIPKTRTPDFRFGPRPIMAPVPAVPGSSGRVREGNHYISYMDPEKNIGRRTGRLARLTPSARSGYSSLIARSTDLRSCQCSNRLFPVPLARLCRGDKGVLVVGIDDARVLSDIRRS